MVTETEILQTFQKAFEHSIYGFNTECFCQVSSNIYQYVIGKKKDLNEEELESFIWSINNELGVEALELVEENGYFICIIDTEFEY